MRERPTPYHADGGARYLFELGVDQRVFAIGALNSAGHSLEWWRRTLDPDMSYAEFDALAATAAPSVDAPIFLPYLQGSGTPHLLDGSHGAFVGLSAGSDRAVLTRAVMEGVAFGIRHCAEALVGSDNLPGKTALFTGGVPRSRVMRRILANVFGSSIRFRRFSDMSALGAAAHAAVAADLADDAGSWLARFDYGESAETADENLLKTYADMHQRYKSFARRVTAD